MVDEAAGSGGNAAFTSWRSLVVTDPAAAWLMAWPRVRAPLLLVLLITELAVAWVLVAINSFTPINDALAATLQSGINPAVLVNTILTVSAGAASGFVLIWMRRWPRAVLAAATLAALTGLWVVPSIVLVEVAIRGRTRTIVLGALGFVVALELGLMSPYGTAMSQALGLRYSSWMVWLIVHAGAAVALVLLGVLVRSVRDLGRFEERSRERESHQRQLLLDAVRAEERNRIANEMHDVVAHRVSLIALHAGSLELRADDAEVAESARIIRDSAKSALDELRNVLALLHEESRRKPALLHPQSGLVDIDALVMESQRAGINIEYRNRLMSVPPGQLERTAYRIVQEALTNVHKHAPAAAVELELTGAPRRGLRIMIANTIPAGQAVGGSAAAAVDQGLPGSGRGLIGITERIAVLGGDVSYGLDHDRRWVVDATLPWSPRTVDVARA